jgi:HlyD family secretion protein
MKEISAQVSNQTGMGSRPGKAQTKPRRWLPYAGLAAVAVLITVGLWPRPVPAETAKASVGALRAVVSEEGKTRIRQRYTVSAPISGQLRRLPFKAGAEVKAGETVVATIDPVTPTPLDARSRALAEARRDAASANVEKFRAAHDFAAKELKRFEQLFKQQTVSSQELEKAQWSESSTTRELAASASALRQAEAELAEFATQHGESTAPREITAPASGRVLRVLEENARVVAAGTPLLEIGDPADLEVVIEVLSRDGATITPGTRVELEQWGGPVPLQARVRLVEPAAFTKVSALGVEEQRVRVIADLTTPPEQRLNVGDNFRVDARIITWETEQALKVPSGAVFRTGDTPAVFVVVGNLAHLRPVKTGPSSGAEVQILEGLKAGDEVITYPGSRIKEGARVGRIGS